MRVMKGEIGEGRREGSAVDRHAEKRQRSDREETEKRQRSDR